MKDRDERMMIAVVAMHALLTAHAGRLGVEAVAELAFEQADAMQAEAERKP